jgi:hypothetical protein
VTIPWAAANAVLLDVRGPGVMDDSGEVTDEGADIIWAGELECVLSRRHETVVEADMNTPVEVDVLKVRKPPEAVATARPGDQGTGYTVLVEDRRTDTPKRSRFRIFAAEHKGKGEARVARFELVDERTP